MAKTKYFMFDEELWQEGIFSNCHIQNGKLCFVDPENWPSSTKGGFQRAVYLSPMLDSGERETIWHRLRMDLVQPGDSVITFSCLASDDLEEEEVPRWTEERKNPSDIFLFSLKGRYLRFKIEMWLYDRSYLEIGNLRIDFPMETIAKHLPEFYRSDSNHAMFLQKYLGVYQSLIDDLQEDIEGFAVNLDADGVGENCLYWLTEWVAIAQPQLWTVDKLRKLIKSSFQLYAAKGTSNALQAVVSLYCGKQPYLIETAQLLYGCQRYLYDKIYRPLFGDDIYTFYLLIEEEYVRDSKKLRDLKQIAEMYKPAHTQMHIVVLMPFMVLGSHTYLGINSTLSGNRPLSLQDNTTLPFHTVILK